MPASVEFGFDLGATGREPLNNQPFFRYDRIDQMEVKIDQAVIELIAKMQPAAVDLRFVATVMKITPFWRKRIFR